MKTGPVSYLALRLFMFTLLAAIFVLTPQQIQAQDSAYLQTSENFNQEELAQMLAPIALYPDALLAQILMASTYPLEVIEADRWVRENSQFRGAALDAALLNQDWDPSVKAICHFPSTLALMSERITGTTKLGNAFLAQEAEVMDMIQKLRAGAYEHGTLKSTSEQKVIVDKQIIIIEPADPRIIYVPYYDPYYVYGSWWWYPAFPPYYWGPPRTSIRVGVAYWPGVNFSFVFGSWSYFDWHHNSIYFDSHQRPGFVRYDRWPTTPGRWQHIPNHRRGVAYRDKITARKYGQAPQRSMDYRREIRGFPQPLDRVQQRSVMDQKTHTTDQTQSDRYRQKQERVERRIKEQKLHPRDKQARPQGSIDKRNPKRKEQELINLAAPGQKQIEHTKPSARRDNVFNRPEDVEMERQSSKRGRISRKTWTKNDKDDRYDHRRKKP
jgi:hypothetical protein